MPYKLQIRLRDRDHERLKAAADRVNLPVSTYARTLLLGGMNQDGPDATVEALMSALTEDPKLRYRLHRMLIDLPGSFPIDVQVPS